MAKMTLRGVALGILLLTFGSVARPALAADGDLEAGLAYLRAGNNALAIQQLTRYYQRQTDPDIRRQVDLTLNQLSQPLTQDERERAARQLQDIVQARIPGRSRFVLDWRYRNFPVFP